MANQFVQVPPNSTGLKMQTFENTVGANLVESEAVTLVRSSDNTEIGTAAQPARIDPTGTTAQPTTDNKVSVGGTTIQAAQTAATDGTGANEVVRATQRRFSQILTTTPLAANGVFNSAWFDTNQTGDVSIIATVRADQAAATNGFLIQEADDTADANFIFNITASLVTGFATGVSVVASTTTPIFAQVRRRFWRVQYTNGATLQGSFKLAVTANPVLVGNAVSSSGGAANLGGGGLLVGIGGVNQTSLAADAIAAASAFAGMNGFNFVYSPNGTTNAWYYQRTPIVGKNANATASGNTALWSPTAGKKFRIMRYQIVVPGTAIYATTAGALTISFQDSASAITGTTHKCQVGTTVTPGTWYNSGWIDIGNGFLSAAANNVLNINLTLGGTGVLTDGAFVNVWGTEE